MSYLVRADELYFLLRMCSSLEADLPVPLVADVRS